MEFDLKEFIKHVQNGDVFPDSDELDYYIARKNYVFYLDHVIYKDIDNDYCATAQIIKSIININFENKDTPDDQLPIIKICIMSPGGDLDVAFSLADVIMASRCPVYTIALENCYSAAFIVFLAGKKRFVFPHSQLLCHQGSIQGVGGNAEEAIAAMKNYKDVLAKMKAYILDRTNIDTKLFAKNLKKDWYISAEEAVSESFGIADKIVTSFDDILN